MDSYPLGEGPKLADFPKAFSELIRQIIKLSLWRLFAFWHCLNWAYNYGAWLPLGG